ncbi:MAG: hypothetical protein Q9217_003839 [Psora testacea]
MASMLPDPLLSLRRSIASNSPVTLSTSADITASNTATDNLARATHLRFTIPNEHFLSLDIPTRFVSSDSPVDLRSIFFAWQKKDVNIPDYIASAQQLNDDLAATDQTGRIQNLVFVERLDLITWLEGASDESEYITPLEGDSAAVKSAQLASGVTGGVSTIPSSTAGARTGKQVDPRLQEIYNLERRMGDRNSILRGIKPTDFSHVRKYSEVFMKDRKKTNAPSIAPSIATAALVSRDKKSGRRPDPIILLSPSASSLLRMSNIKSFLDSGTYIPPDSALAGSSSSANILHVSRLLPSIDPQRPFRFILVETPEQFKPDYWNRVVAVFTTGQTWQFKSYKWQNAPDLFKNALGIYVGWRGEDVPATVRGWGRGVTSAMIEKWNPQQGVQGRWRDREVVEGIWDRVEESMRSRGWNKDGGPVESGTERQDLNSALFTFATPSNINVCSVSHCFGTDEMRIIELVIDGFKSYAVRTVISGWDDSFNSITGLNGSGKSNILDAICFVLGITSMSTVRAQNIQDLIYKRGQAGVTKASVTIVFDNRDKKKSPIGFEEYGQISVTRQIVLGGTSKYLINGHRAQQQTVQNLFQSVQLNINNPNFLIMQGRITKVLNMKPVEILAMIEEAAGTRMFEDRRDKAFKTMGKKEMKVQEITELLREEIEPKLEKLRAEKRAFLEFQTTQCDVERLTRLVVAHDYVRNKEKVQQSGADLEVKKQRAADLADAAKKMKTEIAHLEEDIEKVKSAREKELRKGGKFQALEEEVKAYSHDVVRLQTLFDLKQVSKAEERDRRKGFEKQVKELEAQVKEKSKIYDKIQAQYDTAKADLDTQTAEVEKKEELLQTLQTGVASREGQESTYQGQLQDARNRVSAAATEQEQAKLKISHMEKRINGEEPRAEKAKEQNSGLLKGLESLKVQAKKLEAELSKSGFEPGKENEMYQREASLQKHIRAAQEQIDDLKRKVANMDFSYSDPSPGFDRSKVKGLVAQLFTLDEDKTPAGTALEICAGGRLYNVVVDSAETGTQLLQNGKLKKRVTIIPLNKIAALKASADKIGAAQKLAPGKVDLALSLVGYDNEVSAAMEYVFGSTLVCKDAGTAKKVTFDPAVRMKSVTLEGDVYDPSGTLSGGSSPNSSGVLVTLQKLHFFTKEMTTLEAELSELQASMAREKKKLESTRKTKQELDLKTHEIKLTEEQIKCNSSSSIIQAAEEMKANIEQLKKDITEAKSRQADAAKDIARIEKDMKDFDSNKDSKLAELRSSLNTLKKAQIKNSISVKTLQKELQSGRLEAEQAGADLGAAQDQLTEVESNLGLQDVEMQALQKEQAQVKDAQDVAQARLDDERAKLTGFDEELKALEDVSRSKASRITEEGLELQKLSHQIDKSLKDQQSATQLLREMEKEHEWIADEKESFGRANTSYDIAGQNMSECKSSLRTLTERFQGMKKKINPKVMNMIDSVEKKEASLKNMMKTVIRDKRKIEETITSLDEYKKEALHKTWAKVNGDFGAIFAELLPGSFAKLDPPEGKQISDGLEVKVSLGKVWKQSLTELSGGQRSLIALSLILALLQFKPAPMYILDEVDAALDLSHTQNIGRLIKTRFKGSQFIVVSLKDGMFQNANRIFKTRFQEGTSVVQALTAADVR